MSWLLRIAAAQGSPRPLALVRIVFGVTVLLKPLFQLSRFWTMSQPMTLRASYFPPMTFPAIHSDDLRMVVLGLLLGIWLIAAAAVTLGWYTRIATVVVTALLGLTLVIDRQLYSNHLYLFALVGLLLSLSECGAAWSLDARRQGEQELVPLWPVSLLRLLGTIVYGYAALAKINPAYLMGHVIAASMPSIPKTAWPLILLISIGGIAAEAFLAVALWRRRWRPWAFPIGLLLHAGMVVGIGDTLPTRLEILLFFLVTVALYVLFLPAERGSRTLFYNPDNAWAALWIPRLKRWDWFRVHRFTPMATGAGLRLSQADTTLADWEGFRTVLETSPVACWFAPLLRLKFIRHRVMKRWENHGWSTRPL